jgi:hypothetical protein
LSQLFRKLFCGVNVNLVKIGAAEITFYWWGGVIEFIYIHLNKIGYKKSGHVMLNIP